MSVPWDNVKKFKICMFRYFSVICIYVTFVLIHNLKWLLIASMFTCHRPTLILYCVRFVFPQLQGISLFCATITQFFCYLPKEKEGKTGESGIQRNLDALFPLYTP